MVVARKVPPSGLALSWESRKRYLWVNSTGIGAVSVVEPGETSLVGASVGRGFIATADEECQQGFVLTATCLWYVMTVTVRMAVHAPRTHRSQSVTRPATNHLERHLF